MSLLVHLLLKAVRGETDALMLLYWSGLFVSGRVIKWDDGEVSEAARCGRWESGKMKW